MKHFLLIFISLFIYKFSTSQTLIKNEYKKRIEFSSFSRGYEYSGQDPNTWKKYYLYELSADYSAYLFPFAQINAGVGLKSSYTLIFTNFSKTKPYKWIGLAIRYYFPYRINIFFLKKMVFFSEVNYNLTDFTLEEKKLINYQKLKGKLFMVPFGIKLPFFRDFSLDIGIQYMNFGKTDYFIARSGLIYSLNIQKQIVKPNF